MFVFVFPIQKDRKNKKKKRWSDKKPKVHDHFEHTHTHTHKIRHFVLKDDDSSLMLFVTLNLTGLLLLSLIVLEELMITANFINIFLQIFFHFANNTVDLILSFLIIILGSFCLCLRMYLTLNYI